jgi:hypothetical protein
MTDAIASLVALFEGIVPQVPDSQTKQKDEEVKAERMIADQIARNKHVADRKLREGGDFGPEDVDWQHSRRAIFDSILCRRRDVLQLETAMPREDVIELFRVLRMLETKGYWERQEEMIATEGRGYDDRSRVRMCKTNTANDFGVWRTVEQGLPEWPLGAALIQEAFERCDFQEVEELVQMFTKVAEIILRTSVGTMRYLMGAPLYHDTEMVVGSEPSCPSVTWNDFFPSLLLPYMPRIPGLHDIDLCGPEARSLGATAASHNQKMAARIAPLAEQGYHFASCSSNNLRIRTVLQPPRLTTQEEHEETTSIYRTLSRSVDRPARHPRFSDDPVGSQPVLGSPSYIFLPPPPTETKSPAWVERMRRWDLNQRAQGPSHSRRYQGRGRHRQDLQSQHPWGASVHHLRPTCRQPHLHMRPGPN